VPRHSLLPAVLSLFLAPLARRLSLCSSLVVRLPSAQTTAGVFPKCGVLTVHGSASSSSSSLSLHGRSLLPISLAPRGSPSSPARELCARGPLPPARSQFLCSPWSPARPAVEASSPAVLLPRLLPPPMAKRPFPLLGPCSPPVRRRLWPALNPTDQFLPQRRGLPQFLCAALLCSELAVKLPLPQPDLPARPWSLLASHPVLLRAATSLCRSSIFLFGTRRALKFPYAASHCLTTAQPSRSGLPGIPARRCVVRCRPRCSPSSPLTVESPARCSRRRSCLSPFAFAEVLWLDSAQFASYSPLRRARSVSLFLRVLPRSFLFSSPLSRCRARATTRSRHRVCNARAGHDEMLRVLVSAP
jgi:hypothetical protein